VEPPSVSPFSDGCLARASGPVMVSFLRNIPKPNAKWYDNSNGRAVLEANAEKDLERFRAALSSRLKISDAHQAEKKRTISLE